MKKLCLLLMLFSLVGIASAVTTEIRTENFSVNPANWVEHYSRGGPQNFGYDAGGQRGGGTTVSGAAPAPDSYSYYADVFTASLTWDMDFYAKGTLVRNDVSVKGYWLGFFNTNDISAGAASRMAIYMEDDKGRFRALYRTDTEQSGTANEGDWRPLGTTTTNGNVSGSFNLSYTAATRTLKLTLGTQSKSVVIPSATTVNSFGLFMNASPTGTGTAKGSFYFDNLEYTAAIPEPATIMLFGLGGLLLRRRR